MLQNDINSMKIEQKRMESIVFLAITQTQQT